MEVRILTKEDIYEDIAAEIIDLIHKKPNCILGLATGSTPLGVYDLLKEAYRNGEVSFKDVSTFNLDEYIGLPKGHKESYHTYMLENLFKDIDINSNNVHIPEARQDGDYSYYDTQIESSGGIDYQILGIGSNGHIAFNEPGSSFDSLTHVVKLKESTRIDNSRFFASIDEVPTSAITMGLASIMKAKKIVLIALGENKADAIYQLINGEPNINMPASILINHPNVIIYCDDLAASKLTK